MAKVQKLEPEIEYRIVEIDKAISAADWSKEDEEALSTLKAHPGYLAYLKKIKLQRALIETSLRAQKFSTLEEFTSVQAWAQCLKWLEGQVKESVYQKEQAYRSLYAKEEEAFESIAKAIKIVGN